MKTGGTIILVEIKKRDKAIRKETWGSFKEICRVHDLPYNSLKMNKMPFDYTDKETGKTFSFEKLLYRTKKR